jgi:hypothetical protein
MKRILFFILIILSLSAKAQTSVYHHFPNSNAYWRESYVYYDGTYEYFHEYQYFINGDTLFNSQLYHKIYKTDSLVVWNTTSGFAGAQNFYNVLSFGLREDSNEHVFISNLLDSIEILLYDFNMNVGDTIHTSISSENLVTGIDSILIGTNYRKKYLLHNFSWNPSDSLFIIEGIGASTGLSNFIEPFFESGGMLDCFIESNAILWSNNIVSNCVLVLSSESLINAEVQIKVSPNPFTFSTLLTTNREFENADVKLYNMFGEQVRQFKLTSNSLVIDRNNLVSGIYFLEIDGTRGNKITRKLLIE